VLPCETTTLIRMALPSEAASIAFVLSESFKEYKSFYTDEAFAATTPTSDQILMRFDEGPVWVAISNDSIVGTVSVVPKGDGALYIRSMAVLPGARGQKVGEMLLKLIEDYASPREFVRLYLSTTPFLTRAIRLYERMGFKRSRKGSHELFGTPLFTMEKTIELRR